MTNRAIFFAAAALAIGLAAPASAETATRTGPNGGTATVDWSTNGNVTNGTVSVAGPNGGNGSGTFTCARGTYRGGCVSSGSYANAAGDTWTRSGATAIGPYRAGHVGVVSGPNGTRSFHRVWWR